MSTVDLFHVAAVSTAAGLLLLWLSTLDFWARLRTWLDIADPVGCDTPGWAEQLDEIRDEVADHPATAADLNPDDELTGRIPDVGLQVDAIFAKLLAEQLGVDLAGPDTTWQRWADLDNAVPWTSQPAPDYWVRWATGQLPIYEPAAGAS